MLKELLRSLPAGLTLAAVMAAASVHTQNADTQAMVKMAVDNVLSTIKSDLGLRGSNMTEVYQLVDQKIMPRANSRHTTQVAMGCFQNQASPEQQQQIQEGFKALLIRTYAGTLSNMKDQTVLYKPFRAAADGANVVMHSTVNNNDEPVALDHRLEETVDGWKVHDISTSGLWLSETYKNQFAGVIDKHGSVAGLVSFLNKCNSQSEKDPAK